MFTIGERYKVCNNNLFISSPTFYGTCRCVSNHENGRFTRIQFTNLTNYFHEPMPYEKWCLIDLHNPYDYIFMKIMKPELAHQIRQRKIPTLANLCRSHIPYKTRIEIQGTYIDDVINVI
jgi:hypothetical protein